jgi:uncharacterized protein (DUF305 family)
MKKQIAVIGGVGVLVVGLAVAAVLALQRHEESWNDRDVSFATNMVPHHDGAVEMADLLLGKEGIPTEVRTLAERIKSAQQPEIDTMNGWLEDWDVQPMAMAGHGAHGAMVSGMMSDAEMQALENATGLDAARLFLEGMITHHKGAIEMAQVEVDEGKYPPAVWMAKSIVQTQQSEITEMEHLLADL